MASLESFPIEDKWKAIVLYGLNQATYKIALAKTLLRLSETGKSFVPWELLAKEFYSQYRERLLVGDPMPQQTNPARLTVMERVLLSSESESEAIDFVGANAFNDVIPRFHNLSNDTALQGTFYEYRLGHFLTLKDSLYAINEASKQAVLSELDARWALLEGAFLIKKESLVLSNDASEIRLTYLQNGYSRKSLTRNIPFLQGYQGNSCFYCGQPIGDTDVHVDHLIPRQFINHDEIWNLVLAHGHCNASKSDYMVGSHFINKLILRNENIMGSNHPWKNKIAAQLGRSALDRSRTLLKHYDNAKSVLGPNYYWNGVDSYNPQTDTFYKKLITVMNN